MSLHVVDSACVIVGVNSFPILRLGIQFGNDVFGFLKASMRL